MLTDVLKFTKNYDIIVRAYLLISLFDKIRLKMSLFRHFGGWFKNLQISSPKSTHNHGEYNVNVTRIP